MQPIKNRKKISTQNTLRRAKVSCITDSPVGGVLSGKRKEVKHKWYIKNRDKLISSSKKNYLKNRKKRIKQATEINKKVSKEVKNARKRKYYLTHPEKYSEHLFARKKLMLNLKISYEEYLSLVEKQNNLCAICGQREKGGKNLAIDHCHKTGKTREPLCRRCNTSIGGFEDDIVLLKKAIVYLEKHL